MKSVSLLAMLMLSLLSWSFAQQRTITGTVTDAGNGDPLIGASVLVKGTLTGTVTDFDGTYQLNIPEGNAVLVITYTGYSAEEVPIGASNVVNISLKQGLALDEVIIKW